MSTPTKIFILDDHSVVIEGVQSILSAETDFQVVGTATDSHEALSLMKSLQPDIVILDITMPGLDGREIARRIKHQSEAIDILVFTMSSSKEHVIDLFTHGASGYVIKGEPISELLMALKAIRNGATFYSSSVQEIILHHIELLESGKEIKIDDGQNGMEKLSVREEEVFVLLSDGLTAKEVAHRLGVSPKTVESHKYNIMSKLGLKSVAQFTKMAFKRNLIKI